MCTYFDNMKMNITFAVALRGKLTWWHKWFTLILILRIFTPYSPLRCFSVFGINTKRFVGFYVLSLLMILADADITTIYTWILVMREVRICEDVHFHFLSPPPPYPVWFWRAGCFIGHKKAGAAFRNVAPAFAEMVG